MESPQTLRCTIERQIYKSANNGFSIFSVSHGEEKPSCILGYMPTIEVGMKVLCEGNWVVSPKFGKEFRVSKAQMLEFDELYEIEKYLGSGNIRGIKRGLAKQIVATFGKDTIKILNEHPERLLEVKGIAEKMCQMISKSWHEKKGVIAIEIFLTSIDISPSFIMRIIDKYGTHTEEYIRQNPYRLVRDIERIGFNTADRIAQKLGIAPTSQYRITEGLKYILEEAKTDGHCFLDGGELIQKAMTLLNVPEERIREVLTRCRTEKELHFDKRAVYLPALHKAEVGIPYKLRDLLMIKSESMFAKGFMASDFEWLETNRCEGQRKAIMMAIKEKVSIITGGPGTGKTTCIRSILDIFKKLGKTVKLAAPTGRAAKVLGSKTVHDASTIHRLLEYSPDGGFKRNTDQRINGDVLIVDECSMIDIELMYSLLCAIPSRMQVVFVGDVDQLPSVGPGNVLRDLIECDVLPCTRLTEVYRQEADSLIVTNAHKVNHGEMPLITNKPGTGFFFISQRDTEKLPQLIRKLVDIDLPRMDDQLSSFDIEVLSPMQKGPAGTKNLNDILQAAINPYQKGEPELVCGVDKFHLHDHVMQTKNNYDKKVFNGECGFVQAIGQDDNGCKFIQVCFEGQSVILKGAEIEDLQLSYAMTIHRSQGGEWKAVVIPITRAHNIMLQRNLLYTAITRAKEICVLVGEIEAIQQAVRNFVITKRNTNLKERLIKTLKD